MIKNIKTNLKRTGKTVKGRISKTEFFLDKPPVNLGMGRGHCKFRINDRFLLISSDFPKIKVSGMKEDYIMSLHVWGSDKSKDDIEIKKEFPNVEMAKEFMSFINKLSKK